MVRKRVIHRAASILGVLSLIVPPTAAIARDRDSATPGEAGAGRHRAGGDEHGPRAAIDGLWRDVEVLLGSASLTDQLEAWYQFDDSQRGGLGGSGELPNEVIGGPDLVEASLGPPGPWYLDSSIGIESAARYIGDNLDGWNITGAYHYIGGSDVSGHWSSPPAASVVTGYCAFEVVSLPGSAGGTILGRWETDDEGAWRLEVTGRSGELGLRYHDGAPRSLGSDVRLASTNTYFAFWEIDDGASTIRLWVYDADGTPLADVSAALTEGIRQSASLTLFGIHGESDLHQDTSATVDLDLVAFWSRSLSAGDRYRLMHFGDPLVISEPGRPARYADIGANLVPVPDRNFTLMRDVLRGNVRHVLCGDSFMGTAGFGRIGTALLKVASFENLTAVQHGARSGGFLLALSWENLGTFHLKLVDNEYGVEFEGGGTPHDYFALPCGEMYDLWCDSSILVPDGLFGTVTIMNSGLEEGETGRLTGAGDTLRVRLLHRRVSMNQFDQLRLEEIGGPGTAVLDLGTGPPRHLVAPEEVLEMTAGLDGDPGFEIREVNVGDAAASGGRTVDVGGLMAYRVDGEGDVVPGQYVSYLGDNSWKWRDWGEDSESDGSGDPKRYSNEQLQRWLEATTVDPTQRLVFWLYCDVEDREPDFLAADLATAVTAFKSACALAGLLPPTTFIVIPHMHARGEITEDNMRVRNNQIRNAAFSLADSDPTVCVFSIYDATDGVYFDGRDEATEWLQTHGFDDFSYGTVTHDLTDDSDLLGDFDLHPAGERGAAFFVHFIVEAIEAVSPEKRRRWDTLGAEQD